MVRGLDLFKTHFEKYSDRYVLIGGTACSLAMEEIGLEFRATKDLDIVLCMEALDGKFVKVFWDFIRVGRYKNQQQSTGKRLFYRFQDPEEEAYPAMLELFSRAPDALNLSAGSHLTPIPVNKEVSSLSAILLDNDYYQFIHAGKRKIDGLPVVMPEYLIPLKAKAWLELAEMQKNPGVKVDRKDVNKHRNDVFRLYRIITMDDSIVLPGSIKEDLRRFLDQMKATPIVDLKNLGLRNVSLEQVLGDLDTFYCLSE